MFFLCVFNLCFTLSVPLLLTENMQLFVLPLDKKLFSFLTCMQIYSYCAHLFAAL